MEKRKKLLEIIIVITIAFVWIHSCMPVDVSSKESSVFTEFFEKLFHLEDMEHLTTVVRKGAHFTEYMVLGLELCFLEQIKNRQTSGEMGKNIRSCMPIARKTISYAGLIALLDETIQYFSYGRGPEIRDVWVDIAGATVGTIAVFLLQKIRKKALAKKGVIT